MSRGVLEYVGGWLLDHPDEMRITELDGDGGAVVLEVSVHPDDMGKIIGRGGRVIRALRSLVRAAGQRDGKTFVIEVVD